MAIYQVLFGEILESRSYCVILLWTTVHLQYLSDCAYFAGILLNFDGFCRASQFQSNDLKMVARSVDSMRDFDSGDSENRVEIRFVDEDAGSSPCACNGTSSF